MQKSTPGFSKGALRSARFHLDFSLIALCRWADTAVLAPFKKAFSHAAQEWYRPKHRDTLAAQCASLWIRHKTGSVSLIAIACSIAPFSSKCKPLFRIFSALFNFFFSKALAGRFGLQGLFIGLCLLKILHSGLKHTNIVFTIFVCLRPL